MKHSESRAGLPRTVVGKWAGGLLLAFIALLAWTIVGSNVLGMEAGSPLAEASGTSMMAAGAAAVATAALSRFRFKDRSWVLVVGMVVPALVIGLVVVAAVTEP